jgi:hypothetical protein
MNYLNFFGNAFWEQEGGLAGQAETCRLITAVVEYPDVGVDNADVDDACALATKRAEAVFTKVGSALSTICAMPKADCSKGALLPRFHFAHHFIRLRCCGASAAHKRPANSPRRHIAALSSAVDAPPAMLCVPQESELPVTSAAFWWAPWARTCPASLPRQRYDH